MFVLMTGWRSSPGLAAGLGRQRCAVAGDARGAKVVVNDPGGSVDGTGGANAVADTVVAEIKAAGGQAVASYVPSVLLPRKRRPAASSIRR